MKFKLLRSLLILITLIICNYSLAENSIKVPLHNGLGSPLPTSFTSQKVLSLIDSQLTLKEVSLIGLVDWPRHTNKYLAFICIPEKIAYFDVQKLNTLQASCMGDSKDNTSVYIALLEKQDNQLSLLAKGKFKELQPASISLQDRFYWFIWRKFDLAAYKLNEQEEAFGIRVVWGAPYAGGSESIEALYLFKIEGPTINRVFAEFIGQQEDIAGDWHDDGTREHFQTDTIKILQVLPSKTNGHYDLLMKDKDPQVKEKQIYKWSVDKKYYLPI